MKPISGFTGLDVSRLRETSSPKSARRAVNVDLTIGGEYAARDGLRHLQSLHAQSKGLYAVGGTLRTVIPGGHDYPLDAVGPVHVKYDHLGGAVSVLLSITAGLIQNSDQVECIGSTWPATAATSGSIIIGGHTFTVTARSSDGRYLTIDSPWLDASLNSYPFALTYGTIPTTFASVTATLANGSNLVNFSGGVLPTDMRDSTISFPSTGFTSTVTFRASDTQLQIADVYNGSAMTTMAYAISNIAAAYPLDTMTGIRAMESIGAQADFGAYPYLVVERLANAADASQGTIFEHHWIRSSAVVPTVAPNTLVNLPFTPGPAVIKMSGKLWAIDDVNGVVRYCSTLNGPSDWTLAGDAGFIPVITYATGDRRLRALGMYDEKLAVVFEDSVQLWVTDAVPSNISLYRNMSGPGTTAQRSLANVLGDLFYFTPGGFRSLNKQALTNQIDERDDIGAKIVALTKNEDPSLAIAIWSQKRGQFLCAFGSRIYAFRYSPKSEIMGWTTWELDADVDALVELAGVLYVRSGNELYRFEPGYADGAEFDVIPNDIVGNLEARTWFDFIEVIQRGTCTVHAAYDLEDSDELSLFELAGTSIPQDRLYLGGLSYTLAIRFTGLAPWTLSAFAITSRPAAW